MLLLARAALMAVLGAGAKKSSSSSSSSSSSNSPNSSPTVKPGGPTSKPTPRPTVGWEPYCREGSCSTRCSCFGSCYNRCVSCRCQKDSYEVHASVSLSHFKCLTEDHRTAVRYALAAQLGVSQDKVG